MRFNGKGSFTVEASLILPVFLFMVITACTCGVELYKEAEAAREQEKTAKIWVVDDFYRFSDLDALIDGEK